MKKTGNIYVTSFIFNCIHIVNFFQSSEDCRRIEKKSATFMLAMYTLKIKSVASMLPIKIKLYIKLKTKLKMK